MSGSAVIPDGLLLCSPSSKNRTESTQSQLLRLFTSCSSLIASHRLLSATSSFFERLRIRFKWFTIRGFRRFRADDWSAFVSWILGGVGIWIVVGT